MPPHDDCRCSPYPHDFDGAVEGQFPHEDPETARWSENGDRFNPPAEAPCPAEDAAPEPQKVRATVDMRDGLAVVTWLPGGPYLTFRISTGEADLIFLAGHGVLRQLKQMLSRS